MTWPMVTQVLKLSKLQIKNILRGQGIDQPVLEGEIQPAELFLLLLADMLEKLVFLQPEQKTLILDAMAPRLEQSLRDKEFLQLGFVDGRYGVWTGNIGFIDLQTGDEIQELPTFPLETISYNLNELYRRGKLKIERRSGMHANRQNTDGNVEEPADVCERTTDSVS